MASTMDNWTLRKRILVIFGSLASFFLIGMFIACVVTIVVVAVSVSTLSEDAMFDQTERHVLTTSDDSSSNVLAMMKKGEESFMLPISFSTIDVYDRSKDDDYCLADRKSYFEYGTTYLKTPLTTDERYGDELISLEASSYYIPGSEPADRASFSSILNDTYVTPSAHVDDFFIPAYRDNTNFVAGYVGFSYQGLFRSYPGVSTITTDPARTYDPRDRGWYSLANENAGDVVYTDPYPDFNGKGWMITMATEVRNPSDEFIGVVGADMLLTEIAEMIDAVAFLETGKMTMFQLDGRVVADKEWDMASDDEEGMTYEDLQDPPVSESLWNDISSVGSEVGSFSYSSSGKSYLVNVVPYSKEGSNGYQKDYLLVTFVNKAEITKTSQKIVDEIEEVQTVIIVVLCCAMLVLMVAVFLLVIRTTDKIVRPFHAAVEVSKALVRNLGSADITEGIQPLETEDVDEVQRFTSAINEMVAHVKKAQGKTQLGDERPNEFYLNTGLFGGDQHIKIHRAEAPPPAYSGMDAKMNAQGGQGLPYI